MYYPKGVLSSMVTCFNNDGSLDLQGIGENIEFQKMAGIKSICVLGGTGEAASMTQEERHQVMEEAMRHADGMKITFGVLAGRPSEILEDIQKAKSLGADAVMVMAPPFVRPSETDVEELFKYYASAHMPMIAFNTPSRSAFRMSASLVERLNRIEEIVGIKESSGDMVLMQDIRICCPHPFALLTGGDNLYLPTLALGGDGGILASAAAIPEVDQALDDALAAGDYEKARQCHYAIKLLDDVLYTASHPIPLKTAMKLRGLPSGICRPPFSHITKEYEEKVIAAMRQIRSNLEGIVKFVDKYPIA